jgi:hypothetical protein
MSRNSQERVHLPCALVFEFGYCIDTLVGETEEVERHGWRTRRTLNLSLRAIFYCIQCRSRIDGPRKYVNTGVKHSIPIDTILSREVRKQVFVYSDTG